MPNTRKNMTPEEIKRFIFAGKASITLRSTKIDYEEVYKISRPKNNKEIWFVNINTVKLPKTRWHYVGYVSDYSPWMLVSTAKSKFNQSDKEWFIFAWLLQMAYGIYSPLSVVEVTHNDFCGRCGRHLIDDKSVERGFGPICWEYVK